MPVRPGVGPLASRDPLGKGQFSIAATPVRLVQAGQANPFRTLTPDIDIASESCGDRIRS